MKTFNPIKGVAAAVVGALCITSLAACGPKVGGSESDDSAPANTDYSTVEPAKEISFWSNHPGNSIDFEEAKAKEFEEKTGIKVNVVTGGGSYPEVYQRFQVAQSTGDAGDLVVLADVTWFGAYLSKSIIAVDDILKAADVDTSTYQTALYDDYLYDGSHYAVPYARSTPIFAFNKEHYRAAGLSEEGPKTWDEAREFSLKLKETSKVAPYGLPPENLYPAWNLSNIVWGYGGDWSDKWDLAPMTDEKTVEAVQFTQDAVKDGWAIVLSAETETALAAGAISQTITSTGALRGLMNSASFDVGISMLPLGPADTDKVVPTGGAGLAIATQSSPEKQLAAAMFAAFLTDKENTSEFSTQTGYLPVQQGADMSELYKELPQFEIAVKQLEERSRSQNYARVFIPGADHALSESILDIWTKKTPVKEGLEDAARKIEVLFDREVKPELDQ